VPEVAEVFVRAWIDSQNPKVLPHAEFNFDQEAS